MKRRYVIRRGGRLTQVPAAELDALAIPGHSQRVTVRNDPRRNPGKCERCGSTKAVGGHHDDYTKPRDVTWLCQPCHMRRHVELREGAIRALGGEVRVSP